jgi:hypothetical protein
MRRPAFALQQVKEQLVRSLNPSQLVRDYGEVSALQLSPPQFQLASLSAFALLTY